MGTVINTAILVTCYTKAGAVVRKARNLGLPCSTAVKSLVNGDSTVMIAPDGSKMGWPDRYVADSAREKMKEWLRMQGCYQWVEVDYGWDMEGQARVSDQYSSDDEDE